MVIFTIPPTIWNLKIVLDPKVYIPKIIKQLKENVVIGILEL